MEPSVGRLRLMTCPFLSDALSAQAFNLINTRITSGDHTDYHSTLSRTRSGLERSSMAAAVSPEPAGVPSFTSLHFGPSRATAKVQSPSVVQPYRSRARARKVLAGSRHALPTVLTTVHRRPRSSQSHATATDAKTDPIHRWRTGRWASSFMTHESSRCGSMAKSLPSRPHCRLRRARAVAVAAAAVATPRTRAGGPSPWRAPQDHNAHNRT